MKDTLIKCRLTTQVMQVELIKLLLTLSLATASLPAFSIQVQAPPSANASVNLAQGMPVVVSSVEYGGVEGNYAVDGDASTRWSSNYSDPQWIYVDLGATYAIDHVVLNWEAYAKRYEIQVSADARSWITVFTEGNGNDGIVDISFAPASARYVRMLGVQRGTSYGYSLWEIEVYGAGGGGTTSGGITSSGTSSGTTSGSATSSGTTAPVLSSASSNLALGMPVVVSSVEYGGVEGNYAVDGDASTRWSSIYSDPQWIYVDLGATYTIDRVVLNWEAYASRYEIQVSADARSWLTVFTEGNGNDGIDDISFSPASARYVRMLGVQRGTSYGYSLWEIEVYGASSGGTTSGGITSSGTSSGTTSGSATSSGTTAPVQTGNISLHWTAPVTRADGTPLSLSDIDGYHVYYGTSAGSYPNQLNVADGTAQSATITNIPVGTYYLVMTTYDVGGRESVYSATVAKTAQ